MLKRVLGSLVSLCALSAAGLSPAASAGVAMEEPAGQASARQPLDIGRLAELRADCGVDDAPVIDARKLPTAIALLAEIRARKSDKLIVYAAKIDGADMAAHAHLLSKGCVIDSELKGSDWEGANAEGLTFIRSDLSGSNFSNAALHRVRFIGTSLEKADLSGAYLHDGIFQGGNWTSSLTDADLSNADLRRFAFSCGITMDEACNTSGADFGEALLNGADFAEFPSWGGNNFTGAIVADTRLHPRAVRSFDGLNLVGDVILSAAADNQDGGLPSARLTPKEFRALKAQVAKAGRDTPSFDCAKALSSTEKLICGPYESNLRSLDRDMAKLWGEAREFGKGSLARQRTWLRSRSECADRVCLARKYETRMSELFAQVGVEVVLAPDASIQFDGEVLPLPAEARSGAVYEKIVPVLKSASFQSATLTGLEDGSIRATGDAVGGNAHLCSMSVDAHYDRTSGWYGAEGDDGQFVPIFRVWDERLFFRYSGNMGDTPDEAGDYLSCGARAGFSTMRNLQARNPKIAD